MKRLTVQIPRPCHEQWADMLPTGQGRFCGSCQKTVVDFTTLSDRDLVQRLSQPARTTCGRFRADQLNRPLMLPSQDAPQGWRRWVGVLAAGLLGWQTAQAQVNQPSPLPHKSGVLDRETQLTKSVQEDTSPQEPVITGDVLAVDKNGRLSPLVGAIIQIKGTEHRISTDRFGTFSLTPPAGRQMSPLVIVVYYGGYESQEISVAGVSERLVVMLDGSKDIIILGELAVSPTPPQPSRLQLPKIKPVR